MAVVTQVLVKLSALRFTIYNSSSHLHEHQSPRDHGHGNVATNTIRVELEVVVLMVAVVAAAQQGQVRGYNDSSARSVNNNEINFAA